MKKECREAKLEWAKTLKVGDLVHDCRCKHISIKEIEDDVQEMVPGFLFEITTRLPTPIGDRLEDAAFWLARKLGRVRLVDRVLTLDDGAMCSAVNCCDDPTVYPEGNGRKVFGTLE